MKEVGAAIGANITYILNMLICDVFIRCKSRTVFSNMIFMYDSNVWNWQELKNYLRIGIPGMLMLCFEWWALELLAIFTGLLGVNELAAQVVIVQMVSFIFMLPLGISYSASALTGNYLGENKIDLAKRFAILTLMFDALVTTIIVILLGAKSEAATRIFTQE